MSDLSAGSRLGETTANPVDAAPLDIADHVDGPPDSVSLRSTVDFRVVRSDGLEVPPRTREYAYAQKTLDDRTARGENGPYRIQRRVTVVGPWEDVDVCEGCGNRRGHDETRCLSCRMGMAE